MADPGRGQAHESNFSSRGRSFPSKGTLKISCKLGFCFLGIRRVRHPLQVSNVTPLESLDAIGLDIINPAGCTAAWRTRLWRANGGREKFSYDDGRIPPSRARGGGLDCGLLLAR